MTEIKIGYHEVKADYTVYELSIADIAKKYGISWTDAKKVLRDYGITTRKKDVEPVEMPTYQIVLEPNYVEQKLLKPVALPVENDSQSNGLVLTKTFSNENIAA